ncbi:hypothetical protein VAWG001_42780 [Aeromonas dhakensis]|nr:lipoprotein [Aeromonas enteropelogenes]BEE02664.1 hypothetical protein VAWG001_42780 [Aeromonas dhakensis]
MRVLFSTVATMIEVRDKHPTGDQHIITNNNTVGCSNMNRIIELAIQSYVQVDTI